MPDVSASLGRGRGTPCLSEVNETRAERIARIRKACADEAKQNIERLQVARTILGRVDQRKHNGKGKQT